MIQELIGMTVHVKYGEADHNIIKGTLTGIEGIPPHPILVVSDKEMIRLIPLSSVLYVAFPAETGYDLSKFPA